MATDVDWGHLLALNGWQGETEEADEVLAKLWWDHYALMFATIEQLLYTPEEGILFCASVRVELKLPKLSDYDILKRLNNLRKNNFLEAMKP